MSYTKRFKLSMAAATLAAILATSSAFAGVSLLITDNDATPATATAVPGGTLSVQVKLLSTTSNTSDHVNGMDYFLQATGQLGVFSLTGRDVTASIFNDPFFTNAQVTDPTNNNNVLNPSNGTDLGGTAAAGVFVSNNYTTFNPALVATLTLAVAPNAPTGNYTLTTGLPNSGTVGYSYSDENFGDHSFVAPPATLSGSGSPLPYTNVFTVTIVPEPSGLVFLGAGLAVWVAHRRRRPLIAA